MECITPITIQDPKEVKKSFIKVPCGKCGNCLSNRRMDWKFRINEELKDSISAVFVTLTYDENNVPISNDGIYTLQGRDLQLFFKKLRKVDSSQIKYYAVGEYGPKTERPHYHAIIFNLSKDQERQIEKKWSQGFVYVGTVTPQSIDYVTKYLITDVEKDYIGRERPKAYMSNGIGKRYLEKNRKYHKEKECFTVLSKNGTQNLPRYYRDRIFNDDEKEQNARDKRNFQNLKFKKKIKAYARKSNPELSIWKDNFKKQIELLKKANKNRKL